ncbi:MAG: hypothetical protein N2645_17790 [Clostridia bacterium]|nr:hypothetical protein [Clostridia bacterium]
MERLKRVVIKEEFVALTGNMIDAVLLNQFIYWSERIKDFDKFIIEEKNRALDGGASLELLNGWFYKKADELAEETMTGLAPNNIRKHVQKLIQNGWIEERDNPVNRWDKVKQYRVNLVKVYRDLLEIGYVLQDYRVDITAFAGANETFVRNNESYLRSNETENRKDGMSVRTCENVAAIPEITTETTTETDLNKKYLNINKELGEILQKCRLEMLAEDAAQSVYQCVVDLYHDQSFAEKSLRVNIDEVRQRLQGVSLYVIQRALVNMRKAVRDGAQISSSKHYLMHCIYNALTEEVIATITSTSREDKEIFKDCRNIFDAARAAGVEQEVQRLKESLPSAAFNTWFRDTVKEIDFVGDVVNFYVDDAFICNMINERYGEVLKECFGRRAQAGVLAGSTKFASNYVNSI